VLATAGGSLIDAVLASAILGLVLTVSFLFVLISDNVGGVFAGTVNRETGKLAALEGLRGLRAVSVAGHHAYCWYFFTQT